MPVLSDKSVVSPVLVGRADCIETFEELFKRVPEGQGQVALISGEAGIGKSRLLAEARARAARLGFFAVEGYCFEADRDLPYAPLLDLLRRFISGYSLDRLARDIGPFHHEFTKLLPELAPRPDRNGLQTVPLSKLDAESEKRSLFHALAQFFLQLTAPGDGSRATVPLFVVVEDLHWSDETTLEFLLYLIHYMAPQPILLVLTHRNDQIPPRLQHFLSDLGRERFATELLLTPLTRQQVDAMLRAIFGLLLPVRAEFLDPIYQLTEGNPFFVEEVLKSLIASGEIFYRDGAWDRKAVDDLHIPRSIRDAVQHRSEQLSQTARRVLALAAVMGRRFDFAVLQELTKMGESELLPVVKELVSAQLVVEESADQLSFRHALTREAVYAMLLLRERRGYHRAIAETLERISAASPAVTPADLAYHYYQAGVWDKALEYSQRAGVQAQSVYAPREAIAYFTRALDSSHRASIPPSTGLLRARGQAYETIGEFENARADYEQVARAANAAQDGAAEWQSLIDLGFLWSSRDYAKTGEYLRRALHLAESLGEGTRIAHTLNRLGNWYLNVEQPLEAKRHHEQALPIFRGLNDRLGIAQTLDLLGLASFNSGDLIGGERYYQQAISLFRELDDRIGLASSLATLPMCGGDCLTNTMVPAASLNQTLGEGEEALRIAREIGWRAGEAYALTTLAFMRGARGDYGPALDSAKRASEVAKEIEHREWLIRAQVALAAIYLDLFAIGEARGQLQQAERLAQESGSLLWIRAVAAFVASADILEKGFGHGKQVLDAVLGPDAPSQTMGERIGWCVRAELAHAEGDAELALQIVDRLISAAPNVSERRVVSRLWKLSGEAHARKKDLAQAEADLIAARAAATEQAAQPILWRIHLALGRVYQARRERGQAEREFAAARAIIQELAQSISEPWLHERFLEGAMARLPHPQPLTPRRAAKREFAGLTERERQVAALVAEGKSNREIAEVLVLSEYTAATHVGNILNKLGFTSRAQIAGWATEKGLAKPSAP